MQHESLTWEKERVQIYVFGVKMWTEIIQKFIAAEFLAHTHSFDYYMAAVVVAWKPQAVAAKL